MVYAPMATINTTATAFGHIDPPMLARFRKQVQSEGVVVFGAVDPSKPISGPFNKYQHYVYDPASQAFEQRKAYLDAVRAERQRNTLLDTLAAWVKTVAGRIAGFVKEHLKIIIALVVLIALAWYFIL